VGGFCFLSLKLEPCSAEQLVRTNVYVDGFNLYFGCLKGTPYRWLDLRAFVERVVPKQAEVNLIRYFTARVTALPGFDPTSSLRQEFYLRALGTLPNVSIHFGEYRANPKRMPLHPPPATGERMVTVLRSDEKGSDVNLASYLLLDGFRHEYEQAIVISNDSDLATPVRMVRDELKLPMGVVFPCTNRGRAPTALLRQAARFVRNVHESALARSQFLNHLSDAKGAFSKPDTW
jgi:hypothetical protein